MNFSNLLSSAFLKERTVFENPNSCNCSNRSPAPGSERLPWATADSRLLDARCWFHRSCPLAGILLYFGFPFVLMARLPTVLDNE